MKRLVFTILIFAALISTLNAEPFLVSDKADDLLSGAVFQLMINGVIQQHIIPVVDNAVRFDVQDFEGQKEIRVRFGNPWPGLENTYKWSDWSEPIVYSFPAKPSTPKGCSIKK